VKRIAIYLRVSTSKQDTDNQLRELTAVADRSGPEVWKVYEDAGISGAKGRDKRPGLDAIWRSRPGGSRTAERPIPRLATN
jgi:DNA invertase Pin-like site-specific DNA recombinase